jgi:pyruvate dehydrogenase E1 component
MYGSTDEYPHGEDVFYYLTVYNEPTVQLPEPSGVDVEGILRGMHLANPGNGSGDRPQVQLLASGVAVPWALKAQRLLADDWGVDADVWSVTSWNELAREAVCADRWNLLHPGEEPQTPYVTTKLSDTAGPVVAVSDFMRAVPDQIAQWVPNDWHSLGTDGFGFADTRAAARRFFHVDAESIVVGALEALAKRGEVDANRAVEAVSTYRIDDPTAVAGVKQEGAGA